MTLSIFHSFSRSFELISGNVQMNTEFPGKWRSPSTVSYGSKPPFAVLRHIRGRLQHSFRKKSSLPKPPTVGKRRILALAEVRQGHNETTTFSRHSSKLRMSDDKKKGERDKQQRQQQALRSDTFIAKKQTKTAKPSLISASRENGSRLYKTRRDNNITHGKKKKTRQFMYKTIFPKDCGSLARQTSQDTVVRLENRAR